MDTYELNTLITLVKQKLAGKVECIHEHEHLSEILHKLKQQKESLMEAV